MHGKRNIEAGDHIGSRGIQVSDQISNDHIHPFFEPGDLAGCERSIHQTSQSGVIRWVNANQEVLEERTSAVVELGIGPHVEHDIDLRTSDCSR